MDSTTSVSFYGKSKIFDFFQKKGCMLKIFSYLCIEIPDSP